VTLRYLPPVYSPVTLGALLAGARAVLTGRSQAAALVADLQGHYGARALLLADSGTTALALALRLATGLRPGPAMVALPAWSCYDLATAADLVDVGVVLYDLDPATLGPDFASLDRALAAGAAAVVAVHPYGVPADLPEIERRAAAAGALVIEDAAQAIGASLTGRPAGSLAPLGVLSFGRGKGVTGGSGGGLLLNPSAPGGLQLPEESSLHASGRGTGLLLKLAVQWLLGRPGTYALPAALPFLKLGQTLYRAPEPPARLSVAAAAVLRCTWPLQAPEVERRSRNAERLNSAVAESGAGTLPSGWSGGRPGWLRLPLVAVPSARRAADQAAARRLGIWPGYPRLLLDLPGFGRRVRNSETSLTGARVLADRLLTLPTHGQLIEADLVRLERWLREAAAASD
jgi:dTDP-4-amino-4,6-dideoxygalactose transaminase